MGYACDELKIIYGKVRRLLLQQLHNCTYIRRMFHVVCDKLTNNKK